MTRGQRTQMYVVRRLVQYSDGQLYEFLMKTDDAHSKSGLLWTEQRIDAMTYSKEEADDWLAEARARNFNNNVICHRVVEA